jgi:hypothetical protein
MADLLSIAASITAILQFTSTVVQYLIDAGNASEDRRELLNEVSSASGFLFVLKELAERVQWTDPCSTSIRALNVQNGPLEQFKGAMKRLESKLRADGLNKVGKTLAWPFQKKEIKDILHTIERQKTLFVLALQNDH